MNTAFDFRDRIAVVTGGSGVLGSAICRGLGRSGATVAVVSHTHPERAQAVVQSIRDAGGSALAVRADVLKRDALEELAAQMAKTCGPADLLVNAAGGARPEATTSDAQPFFDLPEAAIRSVFDLNFLGTFLPCQVFARQMAARQSGVILNIASLGALRPLTRSVAYSAGKAAVMNFTQWLAVHLGQEYSPQIRVNALVPGFFLTEQNRFLLLQPDGGLTERGRRILDHTPAGRLGDPEDLVGPALWLLSDAARFVHGAAIIVDGGLSAYGGV